ncbi:hypothetical protein DENSPDRAFT_836369 [Dentipellis sp. KUC8613]|nr:hypothetical protein DENSPDRAFT_836369 [Dentipellis sp. KUC8613]
MRGFLEDGLRQNHAAGVEYIGNALTIIESGRRTWSNVPKSRRGAIFEWTFWAGVKALFLEIFQHAYSSSPGLDSPYPLETLLEHAEELLKNKGPGPSGEIDPGFLLSFTVYPRSKAFAMKGYYHNQMARIGHGGSADAIVDHLKKAAKYYVKAADCLPPDDESHAWFIWCALEAFWRHGAPLKTTLPLMARIREAIPLFKPIWEHSSSAEGHKALQTALWFEEDMRKGLQEGKFTEDNPIVPEPFSRFEKGW